MSDPAKVNQYQPNTGRMIKEDDSVVNVADVLDDVYDSSNHVLKTSVAAINITGGPFSIADGADETLGAKADAEASSDTGTFSLIALIKRLITRTPFNRGAKVVSNDETHTVNTIQLPATSGTKYQIQSLGLVISGAAVVDPITLTITDDATVIWKEVIPATSGIGTNIFRNWGRSGALESVAANKNMTITASDGGSGVITTLNVSYDTNV